MVVLREFLKLLALASDEIVIGLLLLVVLPEFGVDLPLWAVAVIIGLLVLKDLLVAPFVLRGGLSARPKTGPESLIGRISLVAEDLNPEGLVKVDGELWSAECVNGTARKGEKVRIVAVNGAKVLVERPASRGSALSPRDG
ncbi:hypothetical protein A3L11_01290 [Thermococcus siculi]|uniref:NfeD-like C-terminal domain-containing protein n=1 Tax=Thermococcus siculi TaxID=72803 RepID=A0A2Z2MVM2_9EURY|nr:NfeD family protein [Thermococcus siculi]ASJ07930.1 hypothetical protein A3L11_01290 [Thermococcus siculi]